MALEAMVFQQDLFGYIGKDLNNWSCCEKLDHEKEYSFETSQTGDYYYYNQYGNWNSPPPPVPLNPSSMVDHQLNHHNHLSSSSPEADQYIITNNGYGFSHEEAPPPPQDGPSTTTTTLARPKRRRVKSRKNKDDIENQRMTHIAVERNRRKQMNEYLSVLRSLMPDSYVQRGDQASIIGGAINFVKELEQRLQFLATNKKGKSENDDDGGSGAANSLPFSEFFTFPQYSTAAPLVPSCSAAAAVTAIADVEVTMVESHANIQLRTRRRRPKQLLRMVSGLDALSLTVLHLNVTTAVDQIVLYCLTVKVEAECKLSSVDEIATAVHQLVGRIQEEAILNI